MRQALFFLLGLLLLAPWGAAQGQGTDGPTPPPEEAVEGAVEQAKPEVFYLRDKTGRLLPVPELRLDEYQRLYNWHRRLTAPDPPPFVLERLDIRGTAEEDHVVLDVEVQVQLTEQAKPGRWVRVPLQLNGLVQREPPKHTGEGKFFVEYEPSDGYVAWLLAEGDTTHTLRLKLLALIGSSGDNRRLRLITPQVSTRLEINVPLAPLEATVNNPGANLLRLIRKGDETNIHLDGVGGDITLLWQQSHDKTTPAAPRLDVNGDIRVIVEGLRQATCEANLRVRSFGGPIDNFQVQLPPNMQLLSLDQPGYTVSLIEMPESPGSGRIAEVRLNSATTSEVTVRLLTQRAPEPGQPQPAASVAMDVAAFNVLGAIRQRGHVDFQVEGEWSLRWNAGDDVQRQAEIPERLRQAKVVARFEYHRQPCSLAVIAQRKKKYIAVEPQYEFFVGAGRVDLTATFRYRLRGDTVFRLQQNFSQWQVDDVLREGEPLAGVDLELVEPLEVPVVADPKSLERGFTITVRAHRAFDVAQGTLTIPLPEPLATSRTTATVLIKSAGNVRLTPHSGTGQGLVVESLPATDGQTHRFRETQPGSATSLATAVAVYPRSIVVQPATQVRWDNEGIEVSQRLEYQIAYEPAESLTLEVPDAALDSPSFQVSLDDQTLQYELKEPTNNTRTIAVDLGGQRRGSLALLVRYRLPPVTWGADNRWELPLVRVSGAEPITVDSHLLQLFAEPRLVLSDDEELWVADGGSTERAFLAVGNPDRVRLSRADRIRPPRQTVIRKAWLQTMLSRNQRIDHFAIRLAGSAEQIQFELPEGVRAEGVRMVIDGQAAAEVRMDDEMLVTAKLADAGESGEHVIELWYWYERRGSLHRTMQIQVPQVRGIERADRVFWQLVVPGGEYLVMGPAGLTPEHRWEWAGWYWQLRPGLEQVDLEHWMGSLGQDPLPTATNRYVYTSFGELPVIQVATADRRVLMLLASGAVLVLGILFFSFAWLRHPLSLLAAGLLLLAAAMVVPEFAALVGQAGVLGIALLLLGRLLDLTLRRHPVQSVRGRRVISDSQSTEIRVLRPNERPSQVSTAAASAFTAAPDVKP